ncbi:MAG TPA: cupin domain-containing protein [Solirubrobacteraceae bacterium]|nr:cupin domain-containing protein [Solirubrobacteraceae bacterium]
MEISNLERLESFVTLDGSTIRELAGPAWTAARNQSLAEATVPAGRATIEHFHRRSEEIYHFTSGRGRMRLADEERDVVAGDCVVIPPGTPHKLWATDDVDLVLLCACAPAYTDADTEMTEPPPAA